MKRKTLLLIAVEVVTLIVMGFFLNAMQGNLSLKGYRNDIGEEIKQVQTLLQEAQEEKTQTEENYDAIYQSKAASVAFMAQNNVDFDATDAKMQEYKSLLSVDNVLIVDKSGKVVAQAQKSPADFSRQRYNTLREAFTSGKPSAAVEVTQEDKTYRYYAAKIDDNQLAVIEENPEELRTLLEDTTSQTAVLGNVTIGQTGYVFAVSAQDYLIDYHPNENLVGTDALDAGIPVSDLEDGKFTWIELNGEKLYAGISKIDDTYYVSAVPKAEIESSRNITVGAILFAFFAVITIVITYGVFIMKDEDTKPKKPENYKAMGGFIYNKYVGRKALVLSLVGLICILVISYYMQTLFALSSQSMTNAQRVQEVEETIDRYQEKIDTLTKQYNDRYLSKAKTAAYIIDRNPELRNKNSLQALADVLQIQYVYVFDANGTQVATNSPYTKFQISQDPEDQSYEFNKLLSGADYLIQEAKPDDVSGETRQYIGVSLRDAAGNANGFVQIGVRPSRLEKLMENVQLDNVLDGVKVGVHGFAFAVDKESKTFAYYPESKMVGRAVTESGIEEDMLKDEFSGYMTIGGQTYYANGAETDADYIYVAVPESEIMEERVPLTLAAAGVSLLCLAVTFLILTLTPKRDESAAAADAQAEGESRMIDVTMPDGRTAKTEAASSRWMNITMKWNEKTPEQKISSVVKGIFGCLAIIICLIVIFQSKLFSADSIFAYILGGKWDHGINIFAITMCFIIICIGITAMTIIRKLLSLLSSTFGARGETVCRLLGSFIKYGGIVVILCYCLSMMGVNTTTLLASAGILSLAISFGAKELVADIISGLFIIFEGDFRVGDIIMIGDWRGTVIEIGVRTTKVEDGSQNIKVIRNSNVSNIINMTKRYSYASCDVGIEYGESLERVETILQKEFPNIRKRLKSIQDGPFYKGVVSLGDNSVNIRIVVQCAESDRVQLERDLNREMKLIFDKYNISIPFPQVVVNQPIEFQKATEEEKRSADKFTEEQKEKSKLIGNEEDDDEN
ncbi:MAG: mechanosensitive ion channel [Eubacterium sp.]|nr:mechanosensitive ion channel [Eubacterium sp.]